MVRKLNLNLASGDNIFSSQETRDAEKREAEQTEWLEDLPISLIDDHPDHPYGIRMDADMLGTIESVKEHGVLVRALVRPKADGRYEMLAGYRRRFASLETGRTMLPCIVSVKTDDEATIVMVDSNAQRSVILPSEKAKAYKIKLPAMDRQGERTDLTLSGIPTKLEKGARTADLVGKPFGDKKDTVYQYIALNDLISALLEMVDNKILGVKDKPKMGLYPAAELAELSEEAQGWVLDAITMNDCTPSHAQAIRMRDDFKAEKLTEDSILSIMQEEKPNQVEQFKLPREKLSRFFPEGTPAEKIEATIIKALELLERQQKRIREKNNRDRG